MNKQLAGRHMQAAKTPIIFPMVPRTTANLKPGAFWGIPLESGRYGCGVVLDVKSGSRTQLIVGLTDYVGIAPPDEKSLKGCKLVTQGQIHLKSILLTGKMILGCIELGSYGLTPMLVRDSDDVTNGCILEGYRRVRHQTRADTEIPVMSTWGFMVIASKANALDRERSPQK